MKLPEPPITIEGETIKRGDKVLKLKDRTPKGIYTGLVVDSKGKTYAKMFTEQYKTRLFPVSEVV